MPQLDKLSFFSQFLYLTLLFFIFYFASLKHFFPKLLKLFLIRQELKYFLMNEETGIQVDNLLAFNTQLLECITIYLVELHAIQENSKNFLYHTTLINSTNLAYDADDIDSIAQLIDVSDLITLKFLEIELKLQCETETDYEKNISVLDILRKNI